MSEPIDYHSEVQRLSKERERGGGSGNLQVRGLPGLLTYAKRAASGRTTWRKKPVSDPKR